MFFYSTEIKYKNVFENHFPLYFLRHVFLYFVFVTSHAKAFPIVFTIIYTLTIFLYVFFRSVACFLIDIMLRENFGLFFMLSLKLSLLCCENFFVCVVYSIRLSLYLTPEMLLLYKGWPFERITYPTRTNNGNAIPGFFLPFEVSVGKAVEYSIRNFLNF